MTLKILVLEHYFVRWFENFVSYSSDHRVTPNLNLNSKEVQIFFTQDMAERPCLEFAGKAQIHKTFASRCCYIICCNKWFVPEKQSNDDIYRELVDLLSIFVMQKMWRRWLSFRHYIKYPRLVLIGLQCIQSGSTSEWMNSICSC